MKKVILIVLVFPLIILSCSKKTVNEVSVPVEDLIEDTTEVEQVEMPPCSCFNDIDSCQCFNGVWNLRTITNGFGPTYNIEEGYNVWFYNNQDSTVVICNSTEYGIVSGTYTFTFDDQNDIILLDTLNSEVLSCCGNIQGQGYYFGDNSLTFNWGISFDGSGYFFQRNE